MHNDTHDLAFERHGLTFHYRYVDRGPGPLFVSFPSARPVGKTTVTNYARALWPREIPCSFLFVADPMLQIGEHVRVSAFQGRPEWFAIETVVQDIRTIAERFRNPESQMLLYGSSVGGTAAIQAGTFLREAHVIAECPQIFLRRCHEHLGSYAVEMAQLCYDKESLLDVDERFDDRLDLSKALAVRGTPASFTIFVRVSDKPHVDIHAKPLVEIFPDIGLMLMDDASGKGHTALSVHEVKADIMRLLGLESRREAEPARAAS